MKFRAIFIIAALASLLGVRAQELTVKSMEVASMDLSASTHQRPDKTGNPCGLVKVRLAVEGAAFSGNVLGQVANHEGEYWVYMSEGSYMLQVRHPKFLPLDVNFRDYGINAVQGKATYKLTLIMPQMGNMNIDDGMRYLAMTVEPANALVYIDNQPQVLQNGSLSLLLPMGQHSYRVESPGYESKNGTFTIGGEKLSLPVKLESAMAFLSISTTTQGTQIYVNDQLRGTSSWSGNLPAGTYRVEGRLHGYRSHRQNITLAQRDNQKLTIPALQTVTGNLNVNYQPMNAEVWIDGKKAGNSPDVFRNINVGNHEVELRASGYTSKQERVTIEDGKTAMLSGSLVRQQTAQSQSQAQSVSSSTFGGQMEAITVQGVSFNMIRVEGGTFLMGSNDSDADSDEKPVHQVTLSTYYMGETEVTQALWEAVMGSNPSHFKGSQKPVEQVSLDDCQEFIQKLNVATGKKFRLPTEAEWECAARGGVKSRSYKYSGSNTIGDVAVYEKNSYRKGVDSSDYGTHNVKTKQANKLGLYDMSGNVWEWCQDWKCDYDSSAQTNPPGPYTGSLRVYRGGGWNGGARYCRVSDRNYCAPDDRDYNLGLRLALQ